LYGAALGAGAVNYAKTYFTAAMPEVWLFMLGALFIVVTIFLPKGIIGLIARFKGKRANANSGSKGSDISTSERAEAES
jgi:urea transport system permease protein